MLFSLGIGDKDRIFGYAMIRNLSLTLKDIAESATKAIAAQQNPLGSLAKVVLNNRLALDYLLAE